MPERDLSLEALRIVLGCIGISLGCLILYWEIRDGRVGCESELRKSEQIRKGFDCGSRLPQGKSRIDLTLTRLMVVLPSDHHPEDGSRRSPLSDEDTIV